MTDEELSKIDRIVKGLTILIQSFVERCTSMMNCYHET
jgi:hypothetical protein